MRLFVGIFITVVFSFAILGCGVEARQTDRALFDNKPETVRAVGLRQSIDPLSVAIDAERWTVMMDNAQSALYLKHSNLSEDDLVRIDLALRAGVRDLLELRDALCLASEKPMETCVEIVVPDWALRPPNKMTSLVEYEVRVQWLGEAANRLSQIGCDAGREVSDDQHLCAIE